MGATRNRAASMSRTLRGACCAFGLALSLVLAFAASASALSGTPVKLSEGESYGPPAVAVTEGGTAIVAWADEAKNPYTIKYCQLPVGASACAQTGTLTPAGGADAYINGVKLLVDGATVVLLADVFGVAEEDVPEQEWTSTNGGASFSAVNGGKSVAEGILDADTEPLSPVIVPGSNSLGFAWVTAGGPPTFAEFPLSSPPECSVKAGHNCPFATLQPEGEHILSNEGGFFASQLGANPGVLGVYETGGKPGCASGTFDTAYVYASGEQSSTNNYNISPGSADSAWKVGLSPADCEVDYPAVGGGPSGFGVVEYDLVGHATIYHRFDQATDSFDTPYATIGPEGEESPSVSQDGAGGVYATFLAGFRGEVRLAYSYNGGANWIGPATLSAGGAGPSSLVSSVNAPGQGWAAWLVGESVYAQQFVASDAIPPPAPTTLTTAQTSGTTTGASIAIPAGTIGETDKATLAGANVGTASGTVTYTLYSSSTCAAASKVFSGAGAVTGATAAPTTVSSALSPGTYYWQASYSGNPGSVITGGANEPSVSACGSEVLSVTAAATISGSASGTGTTITITVTCEVVPCTVTVTITVTETTGKAAAARKKHPRTKIVTLATGKFTLTSKGAHKLTVHLTKAGKHYLSAHHGRGSAKLLVSDKTNGTTFLSTRTIAITPAKPKRKKK